MGNSAAKSRIPISIERHGTYAETELTLLKLRREQAAIERELSDVGESVGGHLKEEARLDELRSRIAHGRARIESRHAQLQTRSLVLCEELRCLECRVAEQARTEARAQIDESLVSLHAQRRRQVDMISRRYIARGEAAQKGQLYIRFPNAAELLADAPADELGLATLCHPFSFCLVLQLFEHTSEMVLPIRSISVRGAMADTEGRRLERFAVGTLHELVVFATGDVANEIRLPCRVSRRALGLLEIEWSQAPEAACELAVIGA